jgi:hypothetical protein
MKAILKFTLPEEQEEHHDALNGWRYKLAINQLDEWLRSLSKHQDIEDVPVNKVRDKLAELCNDFWDNG